MTFRTDRTGFALPMTILAIALITAGVIAAFTRVEAEHIVIDSADVQATAFTLAQAGLNERLADRNFDPPDTVYTYPTGIARVSVREVRAANPINPEDDPAVFVIWSTGLPYGPATRPQGMHIVAQYAYWNVFDVPVVAGWTSISGIKKQGLAGLLSGEDAADPRCGTDDVAGIAVPNGGYDQSGGNPSCEPGNPCHPVQGSPPVDSMGTSLEMAAKLDVDWDGIINGGTIAPDYVIPPDAWPLAAMQSDPNFWPVIMIREGFSNTTQLTGGTHIGGRGTLIVQGNLTMSGDFKWDGILLVGGEIRSDGNQTIKGATISGLNVQLGLPVPKSDLGNGTKTFQYDSCAIENAKNRSAAMRQVPDAWADSWRTY